MFRLLCNTDGLLIFKRFYLEQIRDFLYNVRYFNAVTLSLSRLFFTLISPFSNVVTYGGCRNLNSCSTTIIKHIKHFTTSVKCCKMLDNGRRTKIQSSAESWERDLSEYEFNYAINIICVDPTSLTRMMSIWCRFDASSFLALMSKFVSMNLLLVFSFLHKNLCSSCYLDCDRVM